MGSIAADDFSAPAYRRRDLLLTSAHMSGADEWVSVVMPVRDALPYLDASIASILGQSHRRLELVIGDDGSTDGSAGRLAEWAGRDSRIRLLPAAGPGLGPSGSSNWVVRHARYPIVARMDADDLSRPRRIEAQLAALQGAPDAVMVGTLFDCVDVRGRTVRPRERSPLADLAAPAAPFRHGSIMFRREAFERAGGYRSVCDYWEDQELYWRMAAVGRVLVLPEAHYAYRYNHGHARLTADADRVERATELGMRCVAACGRGEDYEPLLAAVADPPGKVSPQAVRAVGSLQLWSGRRPRLLKRMLTRARLGLDRGTFAALVWAVCGMTAPATMRRLLRAWARAREARHGRNWPDGRIYEWRPLDRAGRRPEEEAAARRAA